MKAQFVRMLRFCLGSLIVVVMSNFGVAGEKPDPFATIETAIREKSLLFSRSTSLGKDSFAETTQKPGILIGFELGLGRFANIEVIYAVRPIYLDERGERYGKPHGQFESVTRNGTKYRSDVTRKVIVKARRGYAVGGMVARAGLFLNGMALGFQRIDGAKLDRTDVYASEWIGDRTGGSEVAFDSNSMLVVGIHGKDNEKACQSLGLIYLHPDYVRERKPTEVAITKPVLEAKPVEQPNFESQGLESATTVPVTIENSTTAERQPASNVPEAPVKTAEAPSKVPLPVQAAVKAPEQKPGFLSVSNLLAGLCVTVVVAAVLFSLFGFSNDSPIEETLTEQDQAAFATETDSTNVAESVHGLPVELEAKVLNELTADERILWAGQPSPRVTRFECLKVAGCMLFISLVASAMLATFLTTAKNLQGGAWMVPLVLSLFVLIGLVGSYFAPAMKRKIANQTWYVITNRRAIVGKPCLFSQMSGESAVESYPPAQLQNLTRRDSWFAPNAGDLIFRTERRLEVSTMSHGGKSSSSVREKIVRFGFLGVDAAANVEKLLRQTLIDPLVDKCVC